MNATMSSRSTSSQKVNDQLFASIVGDLETAIDKESKPLNMDSVIISQNDQVYTHYFKTTHELNDLRSISKPILCLALGIALDQGLVLRGEKLNLETLIWPFFEGKVRITNR